MHRWPATFGPNRTDGEHRRPPQVRSERCWCASTRGPLVPGRAPPVHRRCPRPRSPRQDCGDHVAAGAHLDGAGVPSSARALCDRARGVEHRRRAACGAGHLPRAPPDNRFPHVRRRCAGGFGSPTPGRLRDRRVRPDRPNGLECARLRAVAPRHAPRRTQHVVVGSRPGTLGGWNPKPLHRDQHGGGDRSAGRSFDGRSRRPQDLSHNSLPRPKGLHADGASRRGDQHGAVGPFDQVSDG